MDGDRRRDSVAGRGWGVATSRCRSVKVPFGGKGELGEGPAKRWDRSQQYGLSFEGHCMDSHQNLQRRQRARRLPLDCYDRSRKVRMMKVNRW